MLMVVNMKNIKGTPLSSEPFHHLMLEACARFELDCKQACRGLKVSIAVKVFGMGTLIPNNFADEEVGREPNMQLKLSEGAYLPEATEFARRPASAQSSTRGAIGYGHR